MTEPDNLVLQYLRRMDSKLDQVIESQTDLRNRVASLEQQVALGRQDSAHLRSDITRLDIRLDHIQDRLARIERRLDLSEAPES